jgi:hypothetical protein
MGMLRIIGHDKGGKLKMYKTEGLVKEELMELIRRLPNP